MEHREVENECRAWGMVEQQWSRKGKSRVKSHNEMVGAWHGVWSSECDMCKGGKVTRVARAMEGLDGEKGQEGQKQPVETEV